MALDTAGTDTPPNLSKSTPTDDQTYARRWWILAILGLAQLMVVLDSTIVNIALPTAQTDLGVQQRRPSVGRHRVRARLRFSLLLIGGRLSGLLRSQMGFAGRADRLRRSLPRSAARRSTSACSSAPAPCRVPSARLLAPGRPGAAHHHLHRREGAR